MKNILLLFVITVISGCCHNICVPPKCYHPVYDSFKAGKITASEYMSFVPLWDYGVPDSVTEKVLRILENKKIDTLKQYRRTIKQ